VSEPPSHPPILASDAEREQAVARLRDAVGEGRLTLEEFSQRVEVAQAARTGDELAALARDLPAPVTPGQAPAPAPAEHRAICSHLIRRGPWSLPAVSAWRSIFGTIDLDLREARLRSADIRLQVNNVFGTVTVIVPEGIEVVIEGGGWFASQKVETPAQPPLPGAPRLTIDCRGPGGTLYVRARPSWKQSMRQALGKG
jgi:hypothetical protein